MALTKAEVNERFYNAVGGRIEFATEAQGHLHPYAVAKLAAAGARARGRRTLKILELGANNCAFATSLLKLLTSLTLHGEVGLDRIDYFAVEYARPSLEAFVAGQEEAADFHRIAPGAPGGPLVATLTRLGVPQATLYLVHAEAQAFVTGGSGSYDLVILNELLDDLPCRAFFSDADGQKYELAAQATEEQGSWRVVVTAEETAEDVVGDMPPSSLTTTSAEALAIVRGAAERLGSGGMMLVHDYGITERYVPAAYYDKAPPAPGFIELEFPPALDSGFPRAFFRVFGSAEANVVQITTDVDFAELSSALEPLGMVITLPHGNALLRSREAQDDLRRGDGIFLSEFALLGPGDDLQALLARLHAEQGTLRKRFADEFLEGKASVFADLLFVKR